MLSNPFLLGILPDSLATHGKKCFQESWKNPCALFLTSDIGEEGDGKIPKKLAIIGLWCIQWHLSDRPSMKIVVQMLEGGGESLSMPPNPLVPTGPTTRNARRLELEAIAELE
ncbi:hypothetical protein DVH24_006216 [Malus domestica]|uniref:S-locus receptor kinase C-terminal domain-containing protein n=1 Tax=Malus domestica TaxID=3750 RepID=A0A498K9K4_MALDO|nr:hypothetical protein DVH24_006216 [Malus domestica]